MAAVEALDSNEKRMKRIGIYFFYDQAGIVDEYNLVLLRDLKQNLEKLLVVCNGELTPEGKARFSSVADEVLVRENRGFDVWAYKEGMAHYGWSELSRYDELVLLNFTNYGPVYPLEEMFAAMEQREADFWGIVMRYGFPHDPYNRCKYGYIPDHVPSAFMVIRNRMLCSEAFQQYWDTMREIKSYEDSICYHEAIFTPDFAAQGFRYALYIDTEDLKPYWDYPLMLYPLELVKNRRCPLFKRKSFYNIYEEFFIGSCGEATAEFYAYLRKETKYDVNLIWDNLLRTVNMADIKDRMQLNYVLPQRGILPLQFSETPVEKPLGRIALLLHIYYEDQIEWCYRYAANMPAEADVYVTTDSEAKREQIQARFAGLACGKLEVRCVENRGRDVSALLIGGREVVEHYDYVCFAHDKKSGQCPPLLVGQSFAYKCFENVLGSADYVGNVVRTFAENPRLGLLVPPPPHHSVYVQTIGHEWEGNFANTKKLAEQLGLQVNMDERRPPIAPLGGMFWFRPQALRKLFAHPWRYEDFTPEPVPVVDGDIMHAVERVYPFVAQDAGYYSAWGVTDAFARLELTNLNYILHERHDDCLQKDGYIDKLQRMVAEKDGYIGEQHEKVAALQQTVEEKDRYIALLEEQTNSQQAELNAVYASRSWRITKPLRWISKRLGGT